MKTLFQFLKKVLSIEPNYEQFLCEREFSGCNPRIAMELDAVRSVLRRF